MRSRSSAEAVGLEAVGLEAVRLEAVGVGAVGVGAIWVEWRAESGAVAGRALVGKVHVGGREGKARAFDALKLEAEPLLVHGAALLQLGELLLVLQVVLLEGCARAAHTTTRSARARAAVSREGVWVCGCVGVWVCGCVGVWVCGCWGGEPGARTALSLLEEQPLLLELAAELLLLGGQRGLDRGQPLQLPAQLLHPLRFLLRALAQRLVRLVDPCELLVSS